MESSDPSFTQTELDQALAEQAYGLKGYKVTKRTPLESTAEVATLEGVTFDVSLTSRGYQVCSRLLLLCSMLIVHIAS